MVTIARRETCDRKFFTCITSKNKLISCPTERLTDIGPPVLSIEPLLQWLTYTACE